MKMTPEESRQKLFDAMLAADGDREKAAAALGVSIRTFWRYQKNLKMNDSFEKMGWNKPPGPVKGSTRGLDIVRIQILDHIRGLKGRKLDFVVLTEEVFGTDDRVGRSRIYSAMEQLRKAGKLELDEKTGVWAVTD